MKLKQIVHEVAEALEKVPYLANVPVIEEEKGDIDRQLDLKVAQQQVAVMVGWSGFVPVKQSESIILGDAEIVVSVFENTVNNRTTPGAPTICAMAQEIAKALTYAITDGMESPLFLQRITPICELGEQGGGTVTCDVVFKTKAEL